jgi:hypothetical protein
MARSLKLAPGPRVSPRASGRAPLATDLLPPHHVTAGHRSEQRVVPTPSPRRAAYKRGEPVAVFPFPLPSPRCQEIEHSAAVAIRW